MDEAYLSWLRLIPGVSAEHARRIGEAFPDPEILKSASAEDLAKVPGITPEVSARILEFVRTATRSDAAWYRDEPGLYLCPECGSFVGKGAGACPFCGVVFEEDEPAPAEPHPVEELLQARNGEAKICTRCGAFLEPGTAACRVCGSEYGKERLAELPAVDVTPVSEVDLYLCRHCGAFLSEGAESCAICGHSVAGEDRVPGLARNGKGVSKDFLTRWQRVSEGAPGELPKEPAPRDLEGELRNYDHLLEANPSLGVAWHQKGRILLELGRVEEAVPCFELAAQLSPEKEEELKAEVLAALGPIPDPDLLPARWREAPPSAPSEAGPAVTEPPTASVPLEEKTAEELPEPSPLDRLSEELAELEQEPAPPVAVSPEEEALPPAIEELPELAEAPAPESAKKPRAAPAPEPVPAIDLGAAFRALAYYDRLLETDASLRVAWQTKAEILRTLGRIDEAEACYRQAADLEIAERELGRAALTGLQTRAPSGGRAAPVRGGAQGRTNGRVNGLTNGRGRTNGRVNGLTNGMGATNGLTNGMGRVNGVLGGLALGEGRTNGLVNGNGFTNGSRGRGPRTLRPSGREWARSVVGIAAVVLLMILAPILASVFTGTPPVQGIAIDGQFGDWGAVTLLHVDPFSDQTGNPDVNLVGYKVLSDSGVGVLAAYARFEGTAFRGADGGADVLVALIDRDGDPSTGYEAAGFGAEYAVELSGWDGTVSDARLLSFRPTASRSDWFGYNPIGSVRAAASGAEVEFSVDLDADTNTQILLVAVDGTGRRDAGNAVISPGRPAVVVREVTVAPDVITSSTGVPVLRLELEPSGQTVPVAAINVSALGTLPDADVSLSLYRDDGDGTFTGSDTLVGSSGVTARRASFPVSITLSTTFTFFVVADFSVLPANETFGVAFDGLESGGTVSVGTRDVRIAYLATAPSPTVDGAFGDWASVARTPDPLADVRNRTGIAPLQNANVDLTEVASVVAANATFYLRVDGTILGGVDVPNVRIRYIPTGIVDSDLDTVPDNVEFVLSPDLRFDFDNDNTTDANEVGGDVDSDGIGDHPTGPDLWLNTTIPAWYPAPYAGAVVARYIGPIAPRVLEGVDSAIAYVDADNRSSTGLVATFGATTFGLDWAVVVMGRAGSVLASDLYRYQAGGGIPWTRVASVPAAVDGSRLEVSAPNATLNLSADYRTAYYATDWTLSADYGLPIPPGRSPASPGTRSPAGDNVVINEVSPQPNPEWVEVANPTAGSISLSGWTLQRRQGSSWTTIFTFTSQVLGAWGSGSEYLAADLPTNSLPNGQSTIRLRDAAGNVVDVTQYQPTGSGRSWSRFKDPSTGKPMDSDSDTADFYVSLVPSKGVPNDRHRPTIVAAKTRNVASAAPGGLITYTVYYNNTNTGWSDHVWVNDTLPAQVTFVTSSTPYASSSGQTYRWHFTNVGPMSSNSFTVTVRVNNGTGNGVVLVNRADLDYTDQLGRKLTSSSAWANVTVLRPVITVKKVGTPSTALPGDTIVYTVYYNNTGSASAQHVWINDTLPADVTFVSSSTPYTSFSGQTYRWHFTNVAPGPHSFTITVTVNLNATSSALVNWVFLNYTTQNGWKLEESSSSFTIPIPEFSDLAFAAVVPLVLFGIRRLRRRMAPSGE